MIFGILASIISFIISLFVGAIIWAALFSSSPMVTNPYRAMASDNIPDVLEHHIYKKEIDVTLKQKRGVTNLNKEVFIFLAGLITILGGYLLEYFYINGI